MVNVERLRELAKGEKGIFADLVAPPYAYTLKYLEKFYEFSQNEETLPLLKEIIGEESLQNLLE